MKFKELQNDRYLKCVVHVVYVIAKDQTMTKPDQTFDNIRQASAYIKKIKKDYEKLRELYKELKITLKIIKTEETKYEVLDGE